MTFRPARRARRFRALGAAAIVVATAVPVVARAGQAPALPCRTKASGAVLGDWQVFAPPVFQPGAGVSGIGQTITAYAVDPRDHFRVFAANGNSVQQSDDGGCTWVETLALSAVPDPNGLLLPGTTTRILSITIDPTGGGRVWLTAEEGAAPGAPGRPHVAYSDTGQPGTWKLGDQGLPPVGHPLKLVPGPASGRVVYLTFSATEAEPGIPGLPADSPGVLWGSVDGGQTWAARSDVSDLDGVTQIRDLAVDHGDVTWRTIWVVAGGRLLRSANGGATFDVPDGAPTGGMAFTAVETLPVYELYRVLAFSSTAELIGLKEQGGWAKKKTSFGVVQSVTARQGEIAVGATAGGDAALYKAELKTLKWIEITPRDGMRTSTPDVQTAGRAARTFYAKTGVRLYRYLGQPEKGVAGGNDDVPPGEIGDPPPVKGRLTPASTTMTIPAGGKRTVDYTLDLPKSPTPVDLFLLIDNSGSMDTIIGKLKANLAKVAKSLYAQGVSIRVGVGVIGVQPGENQVHVDIPGTPEDEGPTPLYQRKRKIGPVDQEFLRRLNEIVPANRSGDEAQLEALYQVATGRGLRINDLLPVYSVAAGQGASWRSGQQVLRVILHASDERFSDNIKGAHNDAAEVAAVLKAAGILQVGISGGIDAAARDLGKMARMTGAVAPAKGVDCDADGIAEVRAGQPLVCPGTGAGFDRMLNSMLDAIVDLKQVSIEMSKSPIVGSISRSGFRVDVKKANRLNFSVTFDCRGRQPGTYQTDLVIRLRDAVVARGAATVTCGSLAGVLARTPVVPLTPPHQTNVQPVLVPPPPLQPVTQTQVQTQTQVNPQAGSASQEQEEHQLATATNDVVEDEKEELAMSALATGMAMAAAAGSLALSRRSRTAVARSRR